MLARWAAKQHSSASARRASLASFPSMRFGPCGMRQAGYPEGPLSLVSRMTATIPRRSTACKRRIGLCTRLTKMRSESQPPSAKPARLPPSGPPAPTVAYFGASGLEPVGWHRVHQPLYPSRCRLWIDAGFKIDRVTQRRESSMVLFHVALGAGLNCTRNRSPAKRPLCWRSCMKSSLPSTSTLTQDRKMTNPSYVSDELTHFLGRPFWMIKGDTRCCARS